MATLLANHGDELRTWLRANDVSMPQVQVKVDDTKVAAALRRAKIA